MIKRNVKIVILLILIITILVGGLYIYKRLEYNKQSFIVDIYDYVSPQAVEVININREYNLNEIFAYDSTLIDLTKILGENSSVPIVFVKYNNNQRLLIAKASQEQENAIKEYIEAYVAFSYPAKERLYKDCKIIFYSLSNNKFLVCSFYKGLFAASFHYKPIEDLIDSDPENTFFTKYEYSEELTQICKTAPVSLFMVEDGRTLAFNYEAQNDSLQLDGYIFDNKQHRDTTIDDYYVLPYKINFPDSLCIDSIYVSDENKPTQLKIFLNKKF